MSGADLRAFYAEGYRKHRQGTEEPIEKDLLMQKARARLTLEWVAGQLPSVSRHLDLGSSSGSFLEAVRSRYACEAVGIEPGDGYRLHSRGRGLRVFPSWEALVGAREARFDLVSLLHVLEHLPDPVAALTLLRRDHMTPGGHLLIEVPNLAEHEALELSHLQAFTAASLRDAIQRAGFRVLRLRSHGSFRSPVLRLYITALALATGDGRAERAWPLAALRSRLGRLFGVAKRRFFTRYYPDWTWQSPERVTTGRL
jgi:SAM-dependent methyltransferase